MFTRLICAAILCTASLATHADPEIRAQGSESGWQMTIDDNMLTLTTDGGQRRLNLPIATIQPLPNGLRYTASDQGGARYIVVNVVDGLCHDNMRGMPYPNQVEVESGQQQLTGCGGDPATLLQGKVWQIERINRRNIAQRSRATLIFSPDGQIGGYGSCNDFSAQYQLSGEGLGISAPTTRPKGCIPMLIAQQQKILEILKNTRRFDITPNGELVLTAVDEETLEAR